MIDKREFIILLSLLLCNFENYHNKKFVKISKTNNSLLSQIPKDQLLYVLLSTYRSLMPVEVLFVVGVSEDQTYLSLVDGRLSQLQFLTSPFSSKHNFHLCPIYSWTCF